MEMGDYVRFNRGGIKIARLIENINDSEYWKTDINQVILESDIIGEPSSNITDLIEVGDVIKFRIDNVPLETKGYLMGVQDIADIEMLKNIKNSRDFHILSIVTKEQFGAMEYKL